MQLGARATKAQPLPTDKLEFAKRAMGVDHLDPFQEEFLISDSSRVIMCCHRQAGKSSLVAARILWESLMNEGSLCLVVGASLRQGQEFFIKYSDGLMRLRGEGLAVPTLEPDRKLGCVLPSGSRVEVLPGGSPKYLRGFSAPDVVCIDEAAQVNEDLLAALMPALAVSKGGGKLYLLSTPFGRRGTFYRTWEDGGPQWHRILVPVTASSRIPRSFVDEMRETLTDWEFRSEMLCEFTATSQSLFDPDVLAKSLSSDFEPLFGPED
jgi:hypothetical protein